jgi:hypothetical protein
MSRVTYLDDGGRRLIDCRNCGQAARVDVQGDRLTVSCFARCDQEATLGGVDVEQLLAEVGDDTEAADGGSQEKQKPSRATILVAGA